MQQDKRNESTGSAVIEAFGCVVGLVWCLALLVFVIIVPSFIGRVYGASWGLIVSIFCLPMWSELGPPPMPGFLPGILCIGGYLAILIGVISALGSFVRSMIR